MKPVKIKLSTNESIHSVFSFLSDTDSILLSNVWLVRLKRKPGWRFSEHDPFHEKLKALRVWLEFKLIQINRGLYYFYWYVGTLGTYRNELFLTIITV